MGVSGIDASNSAASTGGVAIQAATVIGGTSGIIGTQRGAGALAITVSGAVSGNLSYGIYATNSGAPTQIQIASAASVKGATAAITTKGLSAVTLTNQGVISNLSGAAQNVAIRAATSAVTLNNTGAITGVVTLGAFSNTVNLAGGSVTGAINTGNGSSTLNFTAGTLTGAVNFGGGGGNVANLTNLTSAALSGATRIDGGAAPATS